MKEIKKIRIGNDIRLAVDLNQYFRTSHSEDYLLERKVYDPRHPEFESIDDNAYVNKKTEVYYPNQYEESDENINSDSGVFTEYISSGKPISIRSVKAYIINTSRIDEWRKFQKKRHHFITRYPVEPYVNVFDSTPYDICGCGAPTWNFRPFPHRIVPYGGFGLHPCWKGIYKHVKGDCGVKYCAQVRATSKQNVVEIDYPAHAQKYPGMYKLILVVKVYAPGFNPDNLKTITVDVDDVFELTTSTKNAPDTGISVSVDLVQDILPSIEDGISVNVKDKYLYETGFEEGSNFVTLEMNDGERLDVDLDMRLGWYNDEN